MLYTDELRAFQSRAKSSAVCLGLHLSSLSPQMVELCGLVGLDFVILATEVESVDRSALENMMRAAAASRVVPIVKIRRRAPELVHDAMNAGAPMVMVPHVRSRPELDEMIRASRFEPLGTRGLCPLARYAAYGAGAMEDARRNANRARSIIPIIEDKEALDHLDALMDCPDVDIFEVGPFDLSQSLGLDADSAYGKAPLMRALERICEAARRNDKALLAPLWIPKETDSPSGWVEWQRETLVPMGFNVLYGLETMLMAGLLKRLLPLRDRIPDRGT
jgi:4-hydroxy-2-oxoheptanedioate aldolase